MADFFDSLTQFLQKDLISNAKKILENPNNLSENIISFLNKNNIDLDNIIEINENKKNSNYEHIKEKNINIQNDKNDYENLFFRLNNIENIMSELKVHLKKDN
tara:strand:- start:127 stop:435 length:309 start_codon:yes stop_codon:yes gene_type:complete